MSGCAIGTVRSRLHNAKRNLQMLLAGDGTRRFDTDEDKERTTKMATRSRAGDEQVCTQIEREKRIAKRLRRVSIAAWTFTLLFTLAFAVVTGLQAARVMAQFTRIAPDDFGTIVTAAVMAREVLPLVIVLGILSTLIATLSTVGVFLRLRTASLQDVQLRLAALEAMLTRDDSPNDNLRR